MKKNIVSLAFMAVFLLMATNSQAQSWKDLLNKDNISKVVNAITGTPETIDMTGTWNYKGSAVEFESENLLMKAGGAAAATMAENKLDEQLSKVGIKAGQMNFTFNADSTFTSTVGKKTLKGTYSYDASAKQVDLKFLKLLNLHAKVNCSSPAPDPARPCRSESAARRWSPRRPWPGGGSGPPRCQSHGPRHSPSSGSWPRASPPGAPPWCSRPRRPDSGPSTWASRCRSRYSKTASLPSCFRS